MTRLLAALALALTALPLSPVHADPLLTTWVVERTSSSATELVIDGGAGARNGEYAFAAVASATVDRDGRFTGADGGLFFGITPTADAQVRAPVGEVACHDVPVANGVCTKTEAFGVIGFVIWWSDVTFNRAFVVLRGRNQDVSLGQGTSPGWRLRRWTGTVRVVADDDLVDAATPAGRGVGGFNYAESPGASGGSVALGHLPCMNAGYANVGSGAARLRGGTKDVVATCADWYPPAAAARRGTEWTFDGAAGGVSDVPVRLVVIERPVT